MLQAADVATVLARGSPTRRPGPTPGFTVGDTVRLRSGAVPHHTRLPGYARGKRGTITAVHGPHVFADAHAQGLGEQPLPAVHGGLQRHRTVGRRAGAAGLTVSIDAWEPYLEPRSNEPAAAGPAPATVTSRYSANPGRPRPSR